MPTSYTSLLGLALPVTGELSGTWGATVNDSITSLLDTAVAGTTSITTDADITLTTTTGASNQARQAIILWSPASGTTTRNITAPAQSKIYTVINASGGTQSIVFRGVGPTTGVTIVKGESAVVAWNGSDFIKVSNTSGAGTFTDLTVTGNLGVGTSSPTAKLEVFGGYVISGTASSVNGSKILGGYYTSGHLATFGGEFSSGGPVIGYGVWPSTSASGAFVSATTINVARGAYTIVGDQHVWSGGGAQTVAIDSAVTTSERMRLDASGNLGLGVTPSAWSSGSGRAIEIGPSATGFLFNDSNNTNLGSNAYFNAGWKYQTSSVGASRYAQSSGSHTWYTAGSGTAGNAITFTQAMTLDASGNLGVGTTSPDTRLHVDGATNTTIRVTSTTNADFRGFGIGAAEADTAEYASFKLNVDTGELRTYVGPSTYGGFQTFYTNGSERARITSGGNLLVGTTSSSSTAIITSVGNAGGYAFLSDGSDTNNILLSYNASAGVNQFAIRHNLGNTEIGAIRADGGLVFLAGNTERARIDSSGNLLVGTTSQPTFATSRAVVSYGNADYAFAVVNSNAVPYGMAMGYTGAAPNSTSSAFFYCQDSGPTQRFSVRSNGGVYNYQANDVNLSDRREKTNFAPAKSYLDTICAISVQTFNYIDQNMEEDPGLTLGVVAQDVQAVAPELVMESNWGSKDDPRMRLSIYQTDLQYALMKCIQELKAEVDSLKSQLKGA